MALLYVAVLFFSLSALVPSPWNSYLWSHWIASAVFCLYERPAKALLGHVESHCIFATVENVVCLRMCCWLLVSFCVSEDYFSVLQDLRPEGLLSQLWSELFMVFIQMWPFSLYQATQQWFIRYRLGSILSIVPCRWIASACGHWMVTNKNITPYPLSKDTFSVWGKLSYQYCRWLEPAGMCLLNSWARWRKSYTKVLLICWLSFSDWNFAFIMYICKKSVVGRRICAWWGHIK